MAHDEICHPSGESMHEQLSALMEATGAKSLFVASDNPIGAANANEDAVFSFGAVFAICDNFAENRSSVCKDRLGTS